MQSKEDTMDSPQSQLQFLIAQSIGDYSALLRVNAKVLKRCTKCGNYRSVKSYSVGASGTRSKVCSICYRTSAKKGNSNARK